MKQLTIIIWVIVCSAVGSCSMMGLQRIATSATILFFPFAIFLVPTIMYFGVNVIERIFEK